VVNVTITAAISLTFIFYANSTQKDRFTCPGVNTYFSASVVFGSIGPHRMFGARGPYSAILAAFPIGLALPVLLYFAQRRVSWLRNINPVMLLHGGTTWSPVSTSEEVHMALLAFPSLTIVAEQFNLAYIWPAIPFSLLSMAYLKRRYFAFWAKYNYIASAAFSSAIATASLLIYFALQSNGFGLPWWGNYADSGCEVHACPRLRVTGDEYFGPREGEWV
jgi:hypothetical protein